MLGYLRFPQTRFADFVAVFAVLIVARWQALVQYTYSVDDYAQITQGGVTTAQFLGQKRFVLAAMNETTQFLGIDLGTAPVVTIGLSCALAAWITVRLFHEWCPDLSTAVVLPAAALVFAHPYTAELFTFRHVTLLHYVAYALAAAALLAALQRTVPAMVVGTVLLTLALGTYQVALNVFVVMAATSLAFACLQRLSAADAAQQPLPPIRPLVGSLAAVTIAGTLLYLGVGARLASNFPDPRSAMIGLDELVGRLARLPDHVARHFVKGNAYGGGLVPQSSISLFWIWTGVALLAPLFFGRVALSRRLGMVGVVFATVLVALPTCIGVLIASRDLWLPPRVLMPVGFVWAAVLLLAWRLSGRAIRRGLLATAWVVTLVFVTQNQSIFVDQWRVNTRDRAMVVQMAADLQDRPGWGEVDTIAVVGSRFYYENRVTTAAGNQNVAAFVEPHVPHALFMEVTGRAFRMANAADVARAVEACAQRDVPDEEFETLIDGSLAIVCRGAY